MKLFIKLRDAACERQHGCCCYCGLLMWQQTATELTSRFPITARQAKGLQCTAEHLHARCDGGSNAASNIAAACVFCNRRRHACKCPRSALQYRAKVRARVLQGRWRDASLLANLPPPCFPA